MAHEGRHIASQQFKNDCLSTVSIVEAFAHFFAEIANDGNLEPKFLNLKRDADTILSIEEATNEPYNNTTNNYFPLFRTTPTLSLLCDNSECTLSILRQYISLITHIKVNPNFNSNLQ